MQPIKLNKTSVEAIEPGDKDIFGWDIELKGFAVRVSPKGVRTFIAQYRTCGGGRKGSTRRQTIGRMGALTVDEARKQAKVILGAAAFGSDPSGDKTAKRREMTVAELIEFYATDGISKLKPREAKQKLARLRHHILPLLGRKKVTDLTPANVNRMIKDVTEGKTAKDEKGGFRARIIVTGGKGAAAKVVRDLSAVFKFAKKNHAATGVTYNPCSDADKPTDGKCTRFLTLDEVRHLGEALDELDALGVNSKATNIVRLWVLTGCRRNEILELTWSEVDANNGQLALVGTKEGDSRRPLADAAALLLAGIARTKSPFVFPSEKGQTYYQGTKSIWKDLIALAGLPGVTPHTLRHTIGSSAVSFGETLAMAGAILGHADLRSTQRYAHMQQHPAKAAVDRVVDPIASALSGRLGAISRQGGDNGQADRKSDRAGRLETQNDFDRSGDRVE